MHSESYPGIVFFENRSSCFIQFSREFGVTSPHPEIKISIELNVFRAMKFMGHPGKFHINELIKLRLNTSGDYREIIGEKTFDSTAFGIHKSFLLIELQ